MQIKIGQYLRCIERGFTGIADKEGKFHFDLTIGELYCVKNINLISKGEVKLISVQEIRTGFYFDNVQAQCFMKNCEDFEVKKLMKNLGYPEH